MFWLHRHLGKVKVACGDRGRCCGWLG